MQSPHLAQPYQQAHAPQQINQFAYPSQQPYIQQQVQMGRPPRRVEREEIVQEVRGRPHESCMMREQPQPQNQYVDA